MADTNHNKNYHDPGQDRFERSDASFLQIGIWMMVIAVLLLLTAFAVWGYFDHYTKQAVARGNAERSPLLKEGQVIQTIPGPELQLNPAAGMRVFADQQEKALTEYSWVSREAGVVRIPIAEAKKKVLASGMLKTRSQDLQSTAPIREDGASLPQDSSSGRTFWNLQR